ncbi:MAG: molybdopterin-dependent oxidoreductase, partial [Spirochaetota bacterium]
MGQWHKTQCNMCAVSCAMEMEVEDNRIVNVRPDPDSPRTPHSYCCRKGRSSKYFSDHNERLDYPLKKVGDHFERISWEQAYKEIAEKTKAILDTHGPRSFAYCGGALGCAQGDLAFVNTSVLPMIGSQYVYNPVGLEFMGNWWSHGRIIGDQTLFCEPDEKNLDVIILWGSNTYVAHNVGESRFLIRHLSEDPDKTVVVVDPRLSETARMADLHIPVRVGSDSLFLRGMLSLILDEGWQDQNYLDTYARDFNQVKPWLKGFEYKEAFRVCGVSYESAKEFCRLLCTKTWGVHQDLGLFCGRNNTMNSYLMVLLMA